MTKDELKKEAEEYLYKRLQFDKGFIEQELHRKYNPTEAWEKFEPIDPIINETLEAYLAGSEPREKRIAELEQENAELKKQLGMSKKVYNDNLDYSHHIEDQLTNAKEIIRSLYSVIQDRIDYKGNIPLEDEMYRAKQYLE